LVIWEVSTWMGSIKISISDGLVGTKYSIGMNGWNPYTNWKGIDDQ
jgi:hypothetical protein